MDTLPGRVESHLVEMIPHQFRSLAKLRKAFPDNHRDFGSLLLVNTRSSVAHEEGADFSLSSVPLGNELDEASMFGEPYSLVLDATVVDDGSGDIAISAQYDPRILTEDQLRLVLGQYEEAIRLLASGASTSLSAVSLLSEQDHQRLVEWAGKPIQTSDLLCVHETVERVATACPNYPAVEGFGESLTYEELEHGANALACHLLTRSKSIGPGSIVPIWMDTCPSAVVAVLAIHKLGASYVPLDSRLPIARAQHIIDDVEAKLMLVSTAKLSMAGKLSRDGLIVVEYNRSVMEVFEASEPHPPRLSGPGTPGRLSNLAYVIYTSGSTGKPKGVMMEHWALAATIRDQIATFGVVQGSRVLGLSNLSWDPSIFEMFVSLCCGACLCIPTDMERNDDLAGAINRLRANIVSTSPAVASLIDLRQTPTVKTMILGGDRIRDDNIRNAHEAGVRLFNGYGPTEACIDAIVHRNVVPAVGPQNVGRPMSSQVWLVDPANPHILVPPGCVGEIALSGTLARGYLNDPKKTAKSFLTDCSFASPVYLTGDLGRHDVTDGSVLFLGRKDRQVKLNGQRVELGDIESAIHAACPDKGPVVVDYFTVGNRHLLAAYFFTREKGARSTGLVEVVSQLRPETAEFKNLQARLKDVLPAYMIPRIILTASYMPLLSADKVNFSALRGAYERWLAAAAEHRGDGNGHALAAPPTPSEVRLRSMWAAVTGCRADTIQAHDSFFDLGGDSLTAVKLAMRAAKDGTPIPVVAIYSTPVLRDMAKLLPTEDSISSTNDSDTIATPAPFSLLTGHAREMLKPSLASGDDVVDAFPCTTFQTISFIQGNKSHKGHYAWFMFEISGTLDDERLRKACELVCERHSILRTSFRVVGGQLFQVVHKRCPVNFRRLNPCESLDDFSLLIGQDVAHPVGLGQVMTRFRVAAHTGHGTLLAIGMSHAQYDGFCLNAIFNDLYHAYAEGKLPDNEAAPPPAYSRFVCHTLEVSSDPNTASFWANLLRGSTMSVLAPQPTPHRQRTLDGKHAISIPTYRSGPCDTTFAMVASAAWALVLSWLTGTDDVVFGGLVSGRDYRVRGINEIVGACINIIPRRVRLPSGCPVAELLRQVKEQQISAGPYENTSFSTVCRSAGWPSTTRFGSILQHQNIEPNIIQPASGNDSSSTHNQTAPSSAWSCAGAAAYPGSCDYVDCWMMTFPRPSETLVSLGYSTSAIPDDVAARITRLFCDAIAALYDGDPSRLVSELRPQPAELAHIRLPMATPTSDMDDTVGLQQVDGAEDHPFTAEAENSEELAAIQSTLTRLWSEALDLPEEASSNESTDTSSSTSFFALGGESLGALRLAAACEREGLPLGMQDVFDLPTRRMQARRVLERRKGKVEAEPVQELVFEPEAW